MPEPRHRRSTRPDTGGRFVTRNCYERSAYLKTATELLGRDASLLKNRPSYSGFNPAAAQFHPHGDAIARPQQLSINLALGNGAAGKVCPTLGQPADCLLDSLCRFLTNAWLQIHPSP